MASPIAKLFISLGLDNRDLGTGIDKSKGMLKALGSDARNMGTVLGAAAGTAAIGALKIGDEYHKAMASIRIGTGATGDALKGLENDFKAVAGRVPDAIGVTAQVIADLNTRTGLTGESLQRLSEQVLDLSRLTGTDAAGNVANLTRMFGDWSIAVEQQAEAIDKVFTASQATGISVDALAQKVVQFGAPMRGLNLSFDESIALLGKWEKEGVNAETLLASMRLAYGNFVKLGIDPSVGLPALIREVKNLSDEQAFLRVKQIVGGKAASDFFRAIKEGRFDTEDLVDSLQGVSGAVADTVRDTEDWGEKIRTLMNQVKVAVGPITDGFAGIAEAMGNAIFLLPAFGGALGRGLGSLWRKAGMSSIVKGAATKAGMLIGGIWSSAVAVGSKLGAALNALWVAMGAPGSKILASVFAAGQAAGLAYWAGFAAAAAAGAAGIAAAAVAIAEEATIAADVASGKKTKTEGLDALLNEGITGAIFGPLADIIAPGMRESLLEIRKEIGEAWDGSGGLRSTLDDLSSRTKKRLDDAFGRMRVDMSDVKVEPPDVEGPITEEMLAARKAIAQGFGSLKEALKKGSRPQLISRDDRIENMEARQRKVYKQLHKAVQTDDPYNVKYWSKAAIKAQHQLDQMRGKSKTSAADIRAKFEQMGVKVDDTWLDTKRNATRQSAQMAAEVKRDADGIKQHFDNIDLTSSGANWMTQLATGIRSNIATVAAAADEAAAAAAGPLKSESPPKVGPLHEIDKWGGGLIDAWVGGIKSGVGKVRGAGDMVAGAFAPSPSLAFAAAGAGRVGSVTINVGTLVADDRGLDELERRMSRRGRLRERNARPAYNG